MIIRSSTEISLLAISAIYIVKNKLIEYHNKNKISTIPL